MEETIVKIRYKYNEISVKYYGVTNKKAEIWGLIFKLNFVG